MSHNTGALLIVILVAFILSVCAGACGILVLAPSSLEPWAGARATGTGRHRGRRHRRFRRPTRIPGLRGRERQIPPRGGGIASIGLPRWLKLSSHQLDRWVQELHARPGTRSGQDIRWRWVGQAQAAIANQSVTLHLSKGRWEEDGRLHHPEAGVSEGLGGAPVISVMLPVAEWEEVIATFLASTRR
ncbi:MAG: hypothetical protein HPY83_10320 [Anaerolineae bacterium]|nr:hypothetical protein [Anaerolineae bacterium]